MFQNSDASEFITLVQFSYNPVHPWSARPLEITKIKNETETKIDFLGIIICELFSNLINKCMYTYFQIHLKMLWSSRTSMWDIRAVTTPPSTLMMIVQMGHSFWGASTRMAPSAWVKLKRWTKELHKLDKMVFRPFKFYICSGKRKYF